MEPIEPVIHAVVNPPLHLAKADEKILFFLRHTPKPITEDAIKLFYAQYVMRYYSIPARYGDEEWLKMYALAWFDRSVGRIMRRSLLPKELFLGI